MEYIKKACPVGSDFYYSIRKLPSNKREAMIAVQAFYVELENVALHFTDVTVAQARFNWWRHEMIKISQSKPDHPLSIRLQHFKIDVEKLLTLIDGMEQVLFYASFSNFEEVLIQWMRTAGVRELLFAHIEHPEQDFDKEILYKAMLTLELTHYIQYLRQYVRRDLIYFGEDEMKKFHVKRADFQNYKTTANILGLLKYQVEKIKNASANIKSTQNNIPNSLKIRLKINSGLLKVIEKSNLKVLENFIDLTPIKRWWLS